MNSLLISTHDGTTFAYCGGDGPPVVMLHGIISTGDCWTYAFEGLRDRHQVIAPDMPGHGRSEGGAASYSLAFYADWLADVLDALHTSAIALIGHSMGGAIAAAFAIRYPERVHRLVLVDSLGMSSKFPWLAARNITASLPDYLKANLTHRNDPYLLRFFRPWAFLDPWGPPRAVIKQMAALNQPREVAVVWSGTRLLLTDFLLRHKRSAFVDRLSQIDISTLVIWGRHDGILSLDDAREGIGRLSNATLEIIEGCAHEPMLEQPDEFIRVVRPFLEQSG